MLEVMTYADLEKYFESPEGKEEYRKLESAFRRGFYHGTDQVIEALKSGVTLRQLETWVNNDVFDWWYHKRDFDNCLESPKIPKPWKEISAIIFETKGRQCFYCGESANSIDHVIPVTRGGTDNFDNLVPCCRRCNSSKRDKLIEEWRS